MWSRSKTGLESHLMRPGGALVFLGIGNGAELPATVRHLLQFRNIQCFIFDLFRFYSTALVLKVFVWPLKKKNNKIFPEIQS